jgi:sugar (pentulose or hexulose) kinase
MDHALASTTMLYGLHERGFAADLLAEFGVDRATLPEIADASSIAGRLTRAGADLTGLNAGTPIAVGTGDDFSNAIGAGVTIPGLVASSLGTAEVTGAVGETLCLDRDGLVETHGFLDGRYFVSNPGWLSGGAVTWFLSTFGVATAADMSALAASAPVGSSDLLFLPALGCDGASLGVSCARRLLRADCIPRQGRLRARRA